MYGCNSFKFNRLHCEKVNLERFVFGQPKIEFAQFLLVRTIEIELGLRLRHIVKSIHSWTSVFCNPQCTLILTVLQIETVFKLEAAALKYTSQFGVFWQAVMPLFYQVRSLVCLKNRPSSYRAKWWGLSLISRILNISAIVTVPKE